MKIALYHPWIYLKSGLERTILELVSRSRHEWVLYTNHYDPDGTYSELKAYDIKEVNRVSVERNYGAVLGASMNIAKTKLDLENIDVLVVCCDGVGDFITLRNNQLPILNLCFTPLRAVYDDEYRARHLGRHQDRKHMALMLEFGFSMVDRLLWRRYRKIVCISEAVKKRVVAAGLSSEESMVVSYPGIRADEIKQSENFEPFFFLPGRIMWTKNVELGIRAFLQYRAVTGSKYELVIAGMVDRKSKEYFDNLQNICSGVDAVKFHLSPTDEEMNDYYRRCSAVLFTAFNEDLGLTPMEAMSHGKPVIAVNKGGPMEVVEHQKTGYLVSADANDFAVAMELMTGNEVRMREMGAAGLVRVKQFTWDKFVCEMDSLLDKMND